MDLKKNKNTCETFLFFFSSPDVQLSVTRSFLKNHLSPDEKNKREKKAQNQITFIFQNQFSKYDLFAMFY